MKRETQTSAEPGHVAQLIEDTPIPLPTTAEDAGALARRRQ
jgi:hypothetical protein